MIRVEHNVETGEVKEIPLTPDEVKEKEKDADATAEKIATENTAAAAKEHERSALLTKLGITAEEAKLLLGQY